MQKQENFLLEGGRSTSLHQKHKIAIWNRTPPTYTSNLVYMCAGRFRAPKSSNRIELSWFVQDSWGVPPTHVHMHVHARTHTHAHACVVNMVISCKWLPPLDLGKSWEFPMMSYAHACVCACMHVCACAYGWGAPSHHPPPLSTHPPPPKGGTPGIIQNSIALELIEIFQFFLKIWNLWRLPHPWVGV